VETHLARRGNEGKVYDWVRKELEQGRQAYFVYPLIQQSEALDVKDAESMFAELAETVFRDFRIRMLHSRVPEEQKGEVMADFAAGAVDVLVATSVVEVGVDVPNATCMVIEHAERFGLAALHQLRGRVGRSRLQSYAFLIYDEPLTEEARERLKVLKQTTDGFEIAEADMRIRGPGQLTGTRQSGSLELRFADLVRDQALLLQAAEDARTVLERDPGLLSPEHSVIRDILNRAPPFRDDLLAGG
jgi:ATP-dependent DNA helicase RecG